MHPEIKKYWENAGYEINTDVFMPGEGIPYILFWFLMNGDRQLKCIGQSDTFHRNSEAYNQLIEDPPCTNYYFNNRLYSEEKMLRIIRLKAFV